MKTEFSTIDTGLKSMYMHVPGYKMKFIDSLSFFLCPLRKLPETFGIEEVKKGYFPHLFNRPENANYVGPIPHIETYGYSTMKEGDGKTFLQWYNENKNIVFDFDKELIAYCESDVDVLAKSWLKFCRLFRDIQVGLGPSKNAEETFVDPNNKITIASLVQDIYRAYFMPENSIAVINECNQNTSVVENEYLLHMEDNVLHTSLERQKKIGKYFIDSAITKCVFRNIPSP